MMTRRTAIAGGTVAALGAAAWAWPRQGDYARAVAEQRAVIGAQPELVDFVRYATLAANGHNTQPWRFALREDGVRILPDPARRTEVVDPDDHHLFISLGCAAENLMLAAAAHGRPGGMSLEPAGIDVALGHGAAEVSPLYDAIPARQSTRGAYDGAPVSAADLSLLAEAAAMEGVELELITDASRKNSALEAVVAANLEQMRDPAFVDELKDWIRFSPQRAVDTGDGLYAPCSGNPSMPEWLGNIAFNLAFREASETDKYTKHIQSSAGIAVFVGAGEGPEHWMQVGRSFERFNLQATALGIRCAHINQPIEVEAMRAPFAAAMGLGDVRPDLVVRFGRGPATPMSLRRPVGDVLV